MENSTITALKTIFDSRLDTLAHLLAIAERHFAEDLAALFQRRIAPDMLPFGTQIAFTCNQPRNFALWCAGQPGNNLNPDVTTLETARDYIASTKTLLNNINALDTKLSEPHRIDLEGGIYLELSGSTYANDFLMPNFYFHLTTTYDIMRMAGAPIGKRDFMMHLVPFAKQSRDI